MLLERNARSFRSIAVFKFEIGAILVVYQRSKNKMAEHAQDVMWAIKNGDLDAVKQLVETHVRIETSFLSISPNTLSVCDRQHIDVNGELSGGRCGVHYAGDMGQRDVAQYLVERGADVNVSVMCRPIA